MTTKVTIEVPDHARYRVLVKTAQVSRPVPVHESILEPGQRSEVYIHDGLRIVGIEEVDAK
jgi:hypothetical protein